MRAAPRPWDQSSNALMGRARHGRNRKHGVLSPDYFATDVPDRSNYLGYFLNIGCFTFSTMLTHSLPRTVIHLRPQTKLEAVLGRVLLEYKVEGKPMRTRLIDPLRYCRVVNLGKETQHDSIWAGCFSSGRRGAIERPANY